jgi:hypothetical protein
VVILDEVVVLLSAALTEIGVAAAPDQSEAAVLLLIISASRSAEIEALVLLGEGLSLTPETLPSMVWGMVDPRLKILRDNSARPAGHHKRGETITKWGNQHCAYAGPPHEATC